MACDVRRVGQHCHRHYKNTSVRMKAMHVPLPIDALLYIYNLHFCCLVTVATFPLSVMWLMILNTNHR